MWDKINTTQNPIKKMQTSPPTKQIPNTQPQEVTSLSSIFYTIFEQNNEADDNEDYQPHLNNPNSDWQQKMNKLISCH